MSIFTLWRTESVFGNRLFTGCLFSNRLHGRRVTFAALGSALATILLLAFSTPVYANELAREKARSSYTAFLELAAKDDPRRAGALRRLADMQVEYAEELLIDGDQDDAATTAYDDAVARYRELLKSYPDHEDNDAVRYQMARALEALGNIDEARDILTALVQQAPTSAFAEESEFRRGEAFFSDGNYANAASSYAAVINRAADAQGVFLEQAWYKHGWSLFKLADYAESQSAFLNLLRHQLTTINTENELIYNEARYDALTPGGREMLDDALRAMSLSFSYEEGAASIDALLDRDTAPGFEHLLYQDLGDLYRKEERFQDAAESYRAYVARLPNTRYAPQMQLAVIDTYAQAGFEEKVLIAKQAFAREYALNQAGENFWSFHTPEDAPEVVDAVKATFDELTQYHHALAQMVREKPASDPQRQARYAEAVDWYRAWLSSFPQDPETAGTHFLLAELLFDQGAFADAVVAYEATAYDYPTHERAAEAGYAALLAYGEHAKVVLPENGNSWEQQSIGSALKFAETFQTHPEAARVQALAAERLYARTDYAAALSAAESLLRWNIPVDVVEQHRAWLVTAHAQFDQNNFPAAEQAYQKTLAFELDKSPAQRQELIELLAASVYKQGEAAVRAGDLKVAAQQFMRLASVAPTSALLPTSQYDAATTLMELKDYAQAAQVLQAFRDRFPGHELNGEVTRNLSISYLESGDSTSAASELMRLAKDINGELAFRQSANFQAVDIYRDSDDQDNFIDSYTYLLENLSPTLDEEVAAREEIAGIFLEMSSESQYSSWLRSIIDADARAGSASTLRSRTAAARATLVFAQRAWEPFVQVRLNEPLADNLVLKKQRMEQLLTQLDTASQYNIADVTTAAAYRVGQAYAEMADALMTSERPNGLNADELEQYEFLLEEQAFPFEEQAIEIHENNAGRVGDGIYDAWVRQSFSALATLMPGRYQKTEKGVSVADLVV